MATSAGVPKKAPIPPAAAPIVAFNVKLGKLPFDWLARVLNVLTMRILTEKYDKRMINGLGANRDKK